MDDVNSVAALVQVSHNQVVYIPKAFVLQTEFEAAIARAAQKLAPHVVSVIPTLGEDWSGEPAVFVTQRLRAGEDNHYY